MGVVDQVQSLSSRVTDLAGDVADVTRDAASNAAEIAGVRRSIESITSALSTTVLGYSFLENPRGFVLAVMYDAAVSAVVGVVNRFAAGIDQVAQTFVGVVVGDLGTALGVPASVVVSTYNDGIDAIESGYVDLAEALGPAAFLAIPISAIAASAVGLLLITLTWEGYKWVRNVIV